MILPQVSVMLQSIFRSSLCSEYKQMIRLQLAISNLKPTGSYFDNAEELTLKFASISTTLPLTEGYGGKSLFLQIEPEEMQQIFHLYACGLFIETGQGRYFSLIDLQRIKVGDKVVCQEIMFYNDWRETKFKCEFSIATNVFKNPKMPDHIHLAQRQMARTNALNLLKKPPVPKPNPTYNNFIAATDNKEQFSYLYGNNPKPKGKKEVYLPDHLKTMKHGLPNARQSQSHSKNKNVQKNQQVPKQIMRKQPEYVGEDGDFLDSNPPMMEFTNEEETNEQMYRVPQIQPLQYIESADQRTQQRYSSNKQSTQPRFATFNRKGNQHPCPQTPSEFQLYKKDSQQMPPKPKGLTKEEIKAMAKQQAQSKQIKQNVLIPIAKGDKFELVPLSSLKPQEIIDYVQRQRKIQEEAAANENRRKRLEQQEREAAEKNKKLQAALERRQKQKAQLQRQNSFNKKVSKDIRKSVNQLIDEEQESQQPSNQQDEQYMSDFESASLTGSAIRSRISSRGAIHKNVAKEQESALEEDYSQEFDSYSQSMLSKAGGNKQKGSISDYSDSYRSISASYRK